MPSKLELALCVSRSSKMIDVFDIHTGMHLRHISGSFGSIAVLHDSLLISTDSAKNTLSVYNFRLNRLKWKCSIPNETELGPLCVSASAHSSPSSKSIPFDARFLFCGSLSGHIFCWCLLTGALLRRFKAHLQGITALTMSRDGNLLFSGSKDCLAKAWKLHQIVAPTQSSNQSQSSSSDANGAESESLSEFAVFRDAILGVSDIVCVDGQRVFVASRDCTLRVYSVRSDNKSTLIGAVSFPSPLSAVRVDPSNVFLLASSSKGELWRIDLVKHSLSSLDLDIQHILESENEKALLSDVSKVGISGIDISYDGRLAVSAHSDGTAALWDIKFGSKVCVLSKHRQSYDAVVLVCDRLGALAQNEADVKYERFSRIHKGFPVLCRRFFSQPQKSEHSQNKVSWREPSEFLEVNVPSGGCSAADLAVTAQQKRSATEMGATPQSLGDDAFLRRIAAESEGLCDIDQSLMLSMNEKQQKKMKKMGRASEDALARNMDALLDENRRLKGEVAQWKTLHQNLYNFATAKIGQ